YVKIPLQLLILGTGVLVFVFYLFVRPPMLFNPTHDAQIAASPRAAEYAALDREFADAFEARRDAATHSDRDRFLDADTRIKDVRGRAAALVRQTSGDSRYRDVIYVFPTFVTT